MMAALPPPQNGAGVTLPPLPASPASLVDITNAREYVGQLSSSKHVFADSVISLQLIMITDAIQPNAATDIDIGAAEANKAAVIFSHSHSGNAAPAWLTNLNATIQQIANDVVILQQWSEEMPIFLANSQAGTCGPLLNPTTMANGLAPLLSVANPQTQDELQ